MLGFKNTALLGKSVFMFLSKYCRNNEKYEKMFLTKVL